MKLWSESESDTGLRGREAEEAGRDVDQVGTTGEDRGFGRVDMPDRDLQKTRFERFRATSQHILNNLDVVEVFSGGKINKKEKQKFRKKCLKSH